MGDATPNPAAPAIGALLIDAGEAARAIAVSRRKLWELTNRRAIACVRIGRCVRYRPEDLRAFVEGRRA
ncbi:MAG: helix-turn-helix domain-containing protein [Planctomycetes bacterium]|nr:helix-turn-helix domain-containing protein [Planctomycetota bacterium]